MSQEKEKTQKTIREFGLTTLSVNNKATVFFLTVIILIAGGISYKMLPKESFPDVSLPTMYVGTVYPGNSPEDIENLITRPIEKELNSITGVKKITSASVQDYSTIIVEFESDAVISEALQETKDAVDKAKNELPSDLDQDPNVFEMNMNEFPILNINLSGDYSFDQLKEYAEHLEDLIEKLPEINKVNIRGLQEEEVKIMVDIHKLQSLELSFQDIENAIRAENVTISGGSLLTDGLRRSIRVVGEFKEVKEMEEIIIKHEKQNIVFLKDVATINFDFKERESYARLDSKPVVMVDVIKRSGSNLIEASEKINAIVEDEKINTFPEDLKVTVTLDQTINTRNMVSNLENSIISGVILVVVVLLFFLGTRNSLFVGIAIPMSMFLSFFILGALGITINMMTLFGLIMALGMLVDNGIVVVENVYRLMDEGYSPIRAAKEGVGEVAWPIISSTATTLAAFLPLALWPGIMGEFMKYLPITLIIVLSSSLFVALVINPVFTTIFMKVGDDDKLNKKKVHIWSAAFGGIGALLVLMGFGAGESGTVILGNLGLLMALLLELNLLVLTPSADWFQNKFLPKLEAAYEKFLKSALKGRRPIAYFAGMIVLFFVSIILLGAFTPNILFFPDNEPNYVNIFIEEPIGTDIEVTNEFTKKVEKRLDEILVPYKEAGVINAVISQVGKGTSDPGDPLAASSNNPTPHKARLTIEFVEYAKRGTISSNDILKDIRNKIGKYPGVVMTVEKNKDGPPAGKPINIEIAGENIDKLSEISNQVKTIINNANIAGIEELKTDLETGKPELLIDVDRKKARRYGVSSSTIAMELRTSLFGKEISKFKQGEDDYPIQLRLDDKYRYNQDALLNQSVTFRDQMTGQIRQVPISAIAKPINSTTYGAVKRKDLDRVVTVYSNVNEGFNATAINDQLKVLLADFELPEDYSLKFTGEQEQQQKEMEFLSIALLIAVFLILLIIVAQFNRISAPVIILTSVLLSTIGVFLGLVVFQLDFVIMMTMIGIISLAGIVVNNAIVLLDYTILLMNRRKEELGLGEDERLPKTDLITAIVKSGSTRLRPVLLTAITTVLGLIPLATGFNIDFFGMFASYAPNISIGSENAIFWFPMCITIIFGITFATFLTLIIVPVLFLGVERLKYYIYTSKEERQQTKIENSVDDINNVEIVS